VTRRFVPLLCALALFVAHPARADEPVVKIQPTLGDSIPPAETAALKKTLNDYLVALQKKDYAKAGSFIDRATFLESAEDMVRGMATDSTADSTVARADVRRRVFGVGTRDSLEKRSTGALFTSFMTYMDATNPQANAALATASILVLAARSMNGVVHVAYQLTLGPTADRKEPYTQVTAQKMKKVDGRWVILLGD